MILDPKDIKTYGVRVEDSVPAEVIKAGIRDAEFQVVKPMLGNDAFNDLVARSQKGGDDPLINGGMFDPTGKQIYIAGIKAAIAQVATAFILRNKVVATTFGAVVKVSDLSKDVNEFKAAKGAFTIGINYIYEVAECLDIKSIGKPLYNEWTI